MFRGKGGGDFSGGRGVGIFRGEGGWGFFGGKALNLSLSGVLRCWGLASVAAVAKHPIQAPSRKLPYAVPVFPF